MSAHMLAEKWQKNIKAVVIQHTFGQMADMSALLSAIAGRAPVIEDCCHTFASSLNGKTAGGFGVAAFYSFEWGKPLVLGAGGAAIAWDTNLKARMTLNRAKLSRPTMAVRLKLLLQRFAFDILYRPRLYWGLRRLFKTRSRLGLSIGNYNVIGPEEELAEDFRFTMDTGSERRLAAKLRGINSDVARRRKLAEIYEEWFTSFAGAKPLHSLDGADDVLVRFPVYVDNKQKILSRAEALKIEVAGWYSTPVHPLVEESWGLVGYIAGSCPVAEDMAKHVISFPMNKNVSRETVLGLKELFVS